MAKCNYCNSTIVFGGIKEENFRFCNKKCYEKGYALIVANQIPQEVIMKHVQEVHNGACPQCKKSRGPVDVHTAHRIWSFVLLTSWVSVPTISCRTCGVRRQSLNLVSSFLLGWWGLPWGILITPIQISKNIAGMLSNPNKKGPSEKLEQAIKLNLANIIMQEQNSREQA